jgi:hypothetical protein
LVFANIGWLSEIREQILEWALVPGSAAVQPFTVTSNWKTEWSSQRHGIQEGNDMSENHPSFYTHLSSSLSFTKCHDEDGEYTEYRKFNRAAINATCLRTCKNFLDIGMQKLYSKNTFYFLMCNGTIHRSPPTLLLNESTVRPNPAKPRPASDPQTLHAIQTGISEIQNQIDYTSLCGWVYYDPFLRFLHSIGPKKFSLIKFLKFSGTVKLHICGGDRCNSKCSDDLVASLEIYIPIINNLLPNLAKITIYAAKDKLPGPHSFWTGETPPTFEDRLSHLLEKEVRKIFSLKVLEVLDAEGEKLSCAETTLIWFKERAGKRAHERLLANLAEKRAAMVRENNLHCGFCGEGHVWAECYNLCNFCGGFGHFRKTCPAVISNA